MSLSVIQNFHSQRMPDSTHYPSCYDCYQCDFARLTYNPLRRLLDCWHGMRRYRCARWREGLRDCGHRKSKIADEPARGDGRGGFRDGEKDYSVEWPRLLGRNRYRG